MLVHIFLTFELTFPGCFLQYLQPALRRQTGHNRLIFDTNHGLFSDCFQEKSRGLFLSEKGRLAKCLTRQILNKKVCTSAHCRSALQSGQMQTQNQMKGVFTMQINITARDFGGTEFLAQPHRLHLGAQKAEGVDQLEFSLPEQWNGCVVTLHIRHADGTLAEPLALDEAGCVGVGRCGGSYCRQHRQGLRIQRRDSLRPALSAGLRGRRLRLRLGHRRSAAGSGASHRPRSPSGKNKAQTETVNLSVIADAMPPPLSRGGLGISEKSASSPEAPLQGELAGASPTERLDEGAVNQ